MCSSDIHSLRVLFEPTLFQRAELNFKAIDRRRFLGLTALQGTVERAGESFIISAGETVIQDATASFREFAFTFAPRIEPQALADAIPHSGAMARVVFEQLIGPTVVDQFVAEYYFDPCAESLFSLPSDQLSFNGHTGSDSAVVMLDYAASSSTCTNRVNDQRNSVAKLLRVGEAYANCGPQLAALSKEHAMVYNTNDEWTNHSPHQDTRYVKFQDPIVVPLNLWLARYGDPDVRDDATAALREVNRAYSDNFAGVAFSAALGSDIEARIRDLPSNLTVTSCSHIATVPKCSVNDEAWIAGECGYIHDKYPPSSAEPGALSKEGLNIYFVSDPNTNLHGQYCTVASDPDRNAIVINDNVPVETLAHEIGHAFGLRHVSNGWKCSNIMQEGGFTRNSLTLGQVFRMNVYSGSKLNSSGYRSDATEASCSWSNTGDDTCPTRELDFRQLLP